MVNGARSGYTKKMTNKLKRILITGGAGFIGSHTADLLLSKGYQVRVLDNLSEPVHDNGQWPDYLDKRVERVKGSVTEIEDWRKALKDVDGVIHLAAYQDLLPNFSRFAETNVKGTMLLYELIVQDKLPVQKVVVASSQFVYGQGKYECPKDGVVFAKDRLEADLEAKQWEPRCPVCGEQNLKPLTNSEDHQDPSNQYSISKYTQELTALKIGKNYNIPSSAMRYSIVQGPRQSFKNAYSGVLRLFCLKALGGETPSIYEDGQQLRDYVHVADVAAANVLALEDERANYENYNVGGGKPYTVLEFAQIVADVTGRKDWQLTPTGQYRVGDTRHSISDISKLSALGWRPTKTPREAVTEYVAWLKTQDVDFGIVKQSEELMKKMGALRGSKR